MVAQQPEARQREFGRQFQQRQKHKGTQVQARMGQGQRRAVDLLLIDAQQIEVERAWGIAEGPLPTMGLLDRVQPGDRKSVV